MAVQPDLEFAQKLTDLVGDQLKKYVGTPDENELDGNVMLQHAQSIALVDIARSLRIIAEDHK